LVKIECAVTIFLVCIISTKSYDDPLGELREPSENLLADWREQYMKLIDDRDVDSSEEGENGDDQTSEEGENGGDHSFEGDENGAVVDDLDHDVHDGYEYF